MKMDGKMKSTLQKIKTEKWKKNKNIDRNKILEIELVKTKQSNKPDKIQNASKDLNKIQVVDKSLH